MIPSFNSKNLLQGKSTDNHEQRVESSLRPLRLENFVGQDDLRNNLRIFIDAARVRSQAMDHVLLYGPPGLGKTTLAQIIAYELDVGIRMTSGAVLLHGGDLAAILTNLSAGDVLFIDEIHRLTTSVEEILYPAIEDFKLDLIIGKGPSAQSIRIDLPPYTLVGATTRSGLISRPLRERFGIPLRLDFYSTQELACILIRAAQVIGIALTQKSAMVIAERSRGTPRVAVRLLRRVHDFAVVAGIHSLDLDTADQALQRLGIDEHGLDAFDRQYLNCIECHYNGGPVGIETLSAALSEQQDVLEQVVEPFLLRKGFLKRTPRGRMLTESGYRYLGQIPPRQMFFSDENGGL